MNPNNWLKQTDKPLFDDLLWSRPENRAHAGKLLIIGGNLHGFSAAAQAYQESTKAGIGSARVLLPDALRKTVGKMVENGQFAPSTPSGSFSQKALAEWLENAAWADAVLLAGDLGRNSETAIAIEKFVEKYAGPVVITKDAVDYFTPTPASLMDRPQTTIILSLAQLQKLVSELRWPTPVTFSMGLVKLVENLQSLTSHYKANIVVKHLQNIFVAVGGQVSTTNLTEDLEIWRVLAASQAAVWLVQNPGRAFEALTTAVFLAQTEGQH